MSSQPLLLRLTRLAWTLLALVALSSTTIAHAGDANKAAPQATAVGPAQHDGVLSLEDGKLTLSPGAPAAPSFLSGYSRYGVFSAAPVRFATPTRRITISYRASLPPGSALRVDLRASVDGQRWTTWTTDVASAVVLAFPQPISQAQYRLTLLGSPDSSPLVEHVSFGPSSAPATATAQAPHPFSVAPTFRVRGTRQGMIGGRTANGYIIPPRARFVSLPCWCSLATRGVDEYKVRLTYRGRSTVVPVYDVGPYSGRDDYWNAQRTGYPDLERGWPMDHAAYYEGYNNRKADKGYVRFPTAVDVGDGAWWDDLGIVGDQAEVEITLLWMGQDPQLGPPARDPAAAEHSVDELGGDFWQSVPTLNPSAVGCGQVRHAYWSSTVAAPAQSSVVARWQPNLPVEGTYDVYAHVPICPSKKPSAEQVNYLIQHRDGAVEVLVNQQTQTSWVLLGRYAFAAGSNGFVQLSDVSAQAGRTVWFDTVKWVRVP